VKGLDEELLKPVGGPTTLKVPICSKLVGKPFVSTPREKQTL
jgi:hypothetical protein